MVDTASTSGLLVLRVCVCVCVCCFVYAQLCFYRVLFISNGCTILCCIFIYSHVLNSGILDFWFDSDAFSFQITALPGSIRGKIRMPQPVLLSKIKLVNGCPLGVRISTHAVWPCDDILSLRTPLRPRLSVHVCVEKQSYSAT